MFDLINYDVCLLFQGMSTLYLLTLVDPDHFSGLIKLKTLAKLENTVCLLCLPPADAKPEADAENCTVIGYGRLTDGTANSLQTTEGSNYIQVAEV